MVKVTEEQVEFWLGSDMTKTEMIEYFMDIAMENINLKYLNNIHLHLSRATLKLSEIVRRNAISDLGDNTNS